MRALCYMVRLQHLRPLLIERVGGVMHRQHRLRADLRGKFHRLPTIQGQLPQRAGAANRANMGDEQIRGVLLRQGLGDRIDQESIA